MYFGLRPSLFLLPENYVIFSVGLKPRYCFGQSESKLLFFVVVFYNHIIQPIHLELFINTSILNLSLINLAEA